MAGEISSLSVSVSFGRSASASSPPPPPPHSPPPLPPLPFSPFSTPAPAGGPTHPQPLFRAAVTSERTCVINSMCVRPPQLRNKPQQTIPPHAITKKTDMSIGARSVSRRALETLSGVFRRALETLLALETSTPALETPAPVSTPTVSATPTAAVSFSTASRLFAPPPPERDPTPGARRRGALAGLAGLAMPEFQAEMPEFQAETPRFQSPPTQDSTLQSSKALCECVHVCACVCVCVCVWVGVCSCSA